MKLSPHYRSLSLVISLMLMVGCGGGGGSGSGTSPLAPPTTTVPPPVTPTDTTAPTITSVSPIAGATRVPVDAPILANFSEPLDTTTLTTSTFRLLQGSNLVSANVSYSASVATLTPVGALTHNTPYTVTLTTAIRDTASNSLQANFVWSFTTAASEPIADAGAAQAGVAGNRVTLNGSGSSDPNGLTLTYSWTIRSRPAGSVAALDLANSASPVLLPDLAGTYVVELVVNNGQSTSTATVNITATPAAALANIVLNPDFSQFSLANSPPTSWLPLGTASIANVVDGTGNAVRVTNRTAVSSGLRQDVQARLLESDNGQPFVTRLKIKLANPANVRAYLSIADGAGTHKFLMAEQTVRISDQFVDLAGVNTIGWQSPLNTVRLSIEVGQLAEGIYPDYVIDSVLIERDSDMDTLSDREEAGIYGTNAYLADTDEDGTPDDWEIIHGFDPLIDDADNDVDGDGFTSQQEYWAATDPNRSDLFPGKPANPNLNNRGRAILRYLALLPSNADNRVIAGQHVTDAASTGLMGYDHSVTALGQQTGSELGLVEFQYDGLLPNQYQVTAVNTRAEAAWNEGRLVEIKWNPWNPWSGTDYNDSSKFTLVDIKGMLAQDSPANQQALATFNGYLDTVAAGLDALQQKQIVVIWRLMSEMNGNWFWWGHRSQADYIALWRYVFNYLTVGKSLHHLIWVYESDSGTHSGTPSDYYFPGADYVDVVGHNMYDDTWQLPFDLNRLYREYGKVYAFPQAGSNNQSPLRLIQYGWDSMVMINAIRARHPRASYFCAWDTGARFNSIVDLKNADQLLNDPWIVTQDELPPFP